jgi:hypothetical protein
MNNIETLKLALEYLQDNQHHIADNERHVYVMEYNAFIERLERIIAEAEQAQPVAHSLMCVCGAVWDIKADGSEEMVHTPDVPPASKPVAWRWKECINGDFDSWVISASEPPPYAIEKQLLYTAPPQRQPLTQDIDARWTLNGVALYPRQQPLTDEEIGRIAGDCLDAWSCARAIEAAHGIKGEA